MSETHDLWAQFDRNYQSGGLYEQDLPSQRAAREATLIAQIGVRPTEPIDPIEILYRQTEHKFDVLGAELQPGQADFYDSVLDNLDESQLPVLTEATIRELGARSLPDAMRTGSYGQQVIKDGREQEVMEAGRHWLAYALAAADRVVPVEPGDRADFHRRLSASPSILRAIVSVDQQQQRRAAALAALPPRRT